MAWYKDWFDKNYIKLYQHRNGRDAKEQVSLIFAKIPIQKDWAILDLACGTGRHCQLFFEAGYRPTGIDLSQYLIHLGKKRHPHLDLIIGDMREISDRYHLILSLFTSFGYFDDVVNHLLLKRIFSCLEKKGFFWLDFLNLTYLKNNLIPYSKRTIKGLGEVIEKREIKNKRINKIITIENGVTTKQYRESVALYSREKLVEMLKQAGFDVLEMWGDYLGHPLQASSPRAIYLCQTS